MIYVSLSECDKSSSSQHNTAHSLLLSLLSDIGFEDPVISKEQNGRPYVKYENTDISISHSKNLAAVCVATDKAVDVDCTMTLPFAANAVGIDIEHIDKKADLAKKNKLSLRFLSKSVDSIDEFFSLWTQNEACGKISGEGVIQATPVECNTVTFTVVLDSTDEEYSMSIAYK